MREVRILHVDDEPLVSEFVSRSLAAYPELTVRACTSGREALPIASEWRPHLVLLDVAMPGMDGPRALAMLRRDRATADIPIVFTATEMEIRSNEYLRSLGAAGVIKKPLDARTLPATVRSYLLPRPSALQVMRQEFLNRAIGHASRLVECGLLLASSSDPEDRLLQDDMVHLRQTAHLLHDGGTLFGCPLISRDAGRLEEILTLDGSPADIGRAIDALVAQISAGEDSALDDVADSPLLRAASA